MKMIEMVDTMVGFARRANRTALLFALISFNVQATEYFASPDATGAESEDCLTEATAGTIVSAISKATQNDDVVTLLKGATGVYDMNTIKPGATTQYFTITKAVTIRSKSGNPADVVLQGAGGTTVAARCFTINNANAVVNGITIKDFYATDNHGAAAIYSYQQATLVTNCVIRNNRSSKYDGALYKCTLVDCDILDNFAGYYYGIGEYIDMVKCRVGVNACTGVLNSGAPISVNYGTIRDSTLTCGYFTAYKSWSSYGNATISNCTFVVKDVEGTRNTGACESCVLYDCVFTNCVNTAGTNGRNGFVYNSTLYNCTFSNNWTKGSTVGGCVAGSTCYGCTFVSNCLHTTINYLAGGAGGGGYYFDCTFVSNAVVGYVNCRGGALCDPIMVSNCVFVGNSSIGGGGAIGRTTSAGVSQVFDSYFTNNYLSANYSNNGGAVTGQSGTSYVNVSNCVFYGSYQLCGNMGGACCTVNAYDSLFEANVLSNCVGATVGGGAMAGGSAVNCRFINNKDLSVDGNRTAAGACYNVALTNCFFYGNETDHVSANSAIYADKAGIDCVNCTVVQNKNTGIGSTTPPCEGKGMFINCIIIDSTTYDVSAYTKMTNCIYVTANPKSLPTVTNGCIKVASVAAIKFESTDIDEDDAYCLRRLSPARNRGTDVGLTAETHDLAGKSRVVDGIIDIGCYECHIPRRGAMIMLR